MNYNFQLEEDDSKLFEIPQEFTLMKEITGIQLDNFKNEVKLFCNRVKNLHIQVENIDNDEQINNLKDFIQVLKKTILL